MVGDAAPATCALVMMTFVSIITIVFRDSTYTSPKIDPRVCNRSARLGRDECWMVFAL